jgi:hypothetical protein
VKSLISLLVTTLLSTPTFAGQCRKLVTQFYEGHAHYRDAAVTSTNTAEDCRKEADGWADVISGSGKLKDTEGDWYVEYQFTGKSKAMTK